MSTDVEYIGAPNASGEPIIQTLNGVRALDVLRAAMEDAGIAAGWARADLIGHFCNRWNAAVAQAPVAQPSGDDDAGGPLHEGWQIMVGPGHSGYGVYAVFAEYPEEGSVCLATIDPSEIAKATGFELHGFLVYETKFGGHWNFHPKDELPAGDFLKHREHTPVFVRTDEAVKPVHPADELGAFARWFIGENGHAPDHREAEVVKQFKVWCAARSTGAGGATK